MFTLLPDSGTGAAEAYVKGVASLRADDIMPTPIRIWFAVTPASSNAKSVINLPAVHFCADALRRPDKCAIQQNVRHSSKLIEDGRRINHPPEVMSE
ncbi:MAG: hypothetical protein ACLPN6_03025 [Streptosporangiaceae bacterium]